MNYGSPTAPIASAPAASPAPTQAPTGSAPAPAPAPSGGAQQVPGAPPSQVTPSMMQAWFESNRGIGPMTEFDATKFSKDGQFDAAGYHRAQMAHSQQQKLRADLLAMMSKPYTSGDVTIPGFTNEAEVYAFTDWAKQVSSQGLNADQLYRLYHHDNFLRAAAQGGARALETVAGQATPPARAVSPGGRATSPTPGVVVPPPADAPAPTRPGRVPSTRNLAAELFGAKEAAEIDNNPALLFQPRIGQ